MKNILLIALVTILQSCMQYTMVEPGKVSVKNMQLTTPIAWNKSPLNPAAVSGSQQWTNNGHALDDVIIVPGVESGKTLFKTLDKSNPMPSYDSSMLPPEVAEFVETSLNKYYGETEVQVTLAGLAPYQKNGNRGVQFDLSFTNPLGYTVAGKAVAIQRAEQALRCYLYVSGNSLLRCLYL